MKIIHPGHLEYRFCIFGCQILCITYLAIMPQLPPIPAVETPADNIVPSPVKSPEKQNNPGQPVRKPFKCEQYDFSSDTKHGLSVHNRKAHRPEPAVSVYFLYVTVVRSSTTHQIVIIRYIVTIVCNLCDSWIITTDVCSRINNLFIVSN